jgi:hypothetical protein
VFASSAGGEYLDCVFDFRSGRGFDFWNITYFRDLGVEDKQEGEDGCRWITWVGNSVSPQPCLLVIIEKAWG